jgi:hypothetical protein
MKKRTLLLLLLLVCAFLAAGVLLNSLSKGQSALLIPVEKAAAKVSLSPAPISSLQAYRDRREQTRSEDVQTLQGILDSGSANASLLADVTLQLSQITKAREQELAIEGVLLGSGFSPCLAVVAPGSVTVILGRESLSRGEAALVMTLCESHTDEPLDNIKIMTSDVL